MRCADNAVDLARRASEEGREMKSIFLACALSAMLFAGTALQAQPLDEETGTVIGDEQDADEFDNDHGGIGAQTTLTGSASLDLLGSNARAFFSDPSMVQLAPKQQIQAAFSQLAPDLQDRLRAECTDVRTGALDGNPRLNGLCAAIGSM